MQQIIILGLGAFGRRILEDLNISGVDILIIDKNKDRIERYKKKATSAYITDVTKFESLKKIVPDNKTTAIVDLGDNLETSILAIHNLKKIGIDKIFVLTDNDEHAEIMRIVGATRTISPNREASKRIAPQIASETLLNCLSISDNMAVAEIKIPEILEGKTVIESDLRKKYGINVIAVRRKDFEEYESLVPEYRFTRGDLLLAAGDEKRLAVFSRVVPGNRNSFSSLVKRFFGNQESM